ncbi:Receptor-type tyrosine-protein phosphatase N2 [Myotis brandtii]|uniref:Receptor-type tyrosine-protein phosphatase N2 n=1 Tax=Myotis brandtii TaxID=109478 RepID=S7PA99_MYOBR|nr:Receptor-type tyrosine-protein phosphatase N2 [Myotis brandtii]
MVWESLGCGLAEQKPPVDLQPPRRNCGPNAVGLSQGTVYMSDSELTLQTRPGPSPDTHHISMATAAKHRQRRPASMMVSSKSQRNIATVRVLADHWTAMIPRTADPSAHQDDHSRILLKPENSHSNSDYINASPIVFTAFCVAATRQPRDSEGDGECPILFGLGDTVRSAGTGRVLVAVGAGCDQHSLWPLCDFLVRDHFRAHHCEPVLQMDHDPRSPAYIAAQGPLPATVADFWQMVWESGCVVLVMLTPLAENGVRQCYHYWPDEGSNLYHIYEVNLVSEHIWCEDFLVRSFYLKNLQTNETRTVTQFHFLSWYDQGVPSSTRSLLDFRRKVNKCYKGRSCPIIVHCRQVQPFSDGAGRSGTYILIDMVLNKMAKGAKEIDIAATLEHLRDQRPGMVQTKAQFEFALTAVAEEVNAILKALPQ